MQLNSLMNYSTLIHSGIVNPKSTKVKEDSDPQDHVTMDVPLLIRVFELVRESVKTDEDLHHVVEKLLSLKDKGILTMDDYDAISAANPSPDAGQQPADTEPENNELESIRKLAGI